MRIHFSNAELKTIRAAIEGGESLSRKWRKLRWVMLLLGLAWIALAVLQFNRAEDLAAMSSIAAPEGNATSPTRDADELTAFRIALLRQEYRKYVLALFGAMSGGVIFAVTLLAWRSALQPDATTVLLRRILEAHEESPPDT